MPLKQFNQQRFAMNGVDQKCFQQNDAFRMTEIGHEYHRDDYTVCVPPFLSLNTVCVFDCACDARACAILHDESLMMLRASEMRDASNNGSELSGD